MKAAPYERPIRGVVVESGVIRFTILGEPASKANSRQLVRFGDRPAIIKSKKGRDYEKTALLQIPSYAKQMLQGELRVSLKIFYASERPDLDESIILDVLQAKKKDGEIIRAGVYLNDRQVREKHVFHRIDRANPRAEITVELIHNELPLEIVNEEPELASDPF